MRSCPEWKVQQFRNIFNLPQTSNCTPNACWRMQESEGCPLPNHRPRGGSRTTQNQV